MDNNSNIKPKLTQTVFSALRWVVLLLPLSITLFLIANHLSCVISKGSTCWNGLSKDSRTFIYSFAFYFYIFYFILLIFIRKPIKRLIICYVVTVLFPIIIFGSAYLSEKKSEAPELRGIIMIGAYITIAGPGISFDALLSNFFSRPYLKQLPVKELTAPYIEREVYVRGQEARYQENSVIIPVQISGDYLRAVRISLKSNNVSSLFTVGPHSYADRHQLEADYERELLNKGLMDRDEWSISEYNPLIWQTIRNHGRLAGASRIKMDSKPAKLLALIEEKGGRRSRDLWSFDPKVPDRPVNLTEFSDSIQRSIDNIEVARDMSWIYVTGHSEPRFTRVTPNGKRDNNFEHDWLAFLVANGFAQANIDAVKELHNKCLIIAFAPFREPSYPVSWLRLARKCGDKNFEIVGNGEIQVPYSAFNVAGVKVEKVFELPDGNLILMLRGKSVVKLNLTNGKIDNDFQERLIKTLSLPAVKKEESVEEYDWGDIRFGMLTPHPWLIFHSYKEVPKIIVTDINGVKLFETDNF